MDVHPQVKLSVGRSVGDDARDVFESGCVIADDQQPVNFSFQQIQPSRPLVLQIKFATQRPPYAKIDFSEGQTEGGDFLIVTVVNGLTSDGAGTKEPLKIGTLLDRPLFLSFWVTPLGPKNALLYYTLSLGK